MDVPGLPAVLPLLKNEPSPAADEALLEALAQAAPPIQRAILDVLVGRGRAAAGVDLLRRFAAMPAELRAMVLEYARLLYSPLRALITSTDFDDRKLAIEFITLATDTRSAYLLAEVLRQRCRRTRELSAGALLQLAERCLDAYSGDEAERVAVSQRLDEIAAGLSTAIRIWEVHTQPAALEAALLLVERTVPAFREKLGETRSRLADAFQSMISSTPKPAFAGPLLQCLAIAELRSAAGACIGRCRDRGFLDSLLAETHLLADPAVEHACRFIHKDRFEQPWLDALLALPDGKIDQALRLVSATGGPNEAKQQFYKDLLRHGSRDAVRAMLWRLVEDESGFATSILTMLSARKSDELAVIAERECRRREIGLRPTSAASRATSADSLSTVEDNTGAISPAGADIPGPGGAVLPQAGQLVGVEDAVANREPSPAAGGRVSLANPPVAHKPARSLLESPSANDRLASLLRLAGEKDVRASAELVFRMCSDADASVRAAAVALLPKMPGAAAARLLKRALADPEPRVQANAIEALDALGVTERSTLIAAKLSSPDNRVRANAVKSCLRAEMYQAADALLDMLESESAAHRLSALWVVERLQLGSMLAKVEEMMNGDADDRVRARARNLYHKLASRVRSSAGRADGQGVASVG